MSDECKGQRTSVSKCPEGISPCRRPMIQPHYNPKQTASKTTTWDMKEGRGVSWGGDTKEY